MADERTFRPAALLRLEIRLEDFTQDTNSDVPSEAEPQAQQIVELRAAEAQLSQLLAQAKIRGTRQEVALLSQQRTQVRQQIAGLTRATPPSRPKAEQQGDPYSVVILTSPLKAGVDINSYRQADCMEFTIPFGDAPLESQNIRSCLVEYYQGTVPAELFGTKGQWALLLDRANIMFRGFIDSWDATHSEDDAVVHAKARSMIGVLLDAKVDALSPVFRVKKDGEKISAYVNRVLQAIPAVSGQLGGGAKAVFYLSANAWATGAGQALEPTISSKSFLRTMQTAKSRLQGAGSPAGGIIPTDPGDSAGNAAGSAPGTGAPRMQPEVNDMSAWELITQACRLAGGMIAMYDPSIILTDPTSGQPASDYILIRPPRTLFDNAQQGTQMLGGVPDDFDRLLPDTSNSAGKLTPSQVRMMVWGRNIKTLHTDRKLGRVKINAVELSSYNPDSPPKDRQLVVRYPTQKQSNTIGARGDAKREIVYRKTVFGVRDKNQLLLAAQSVYHAMSRQELVVEIETDDLSSYVDPTTADFPNDEPDILHVRYSTPLQLMVARQSSGDPKTTVVTPLSELYENSDQGLRKTFQDQLGRFAPNLNPQTSQAIVDRNVQRILAATQAARRTSLFYTRAIRYDFDANDGFTAKITAVNYVEARGDPSTLSATDAAAESTFLSTPANLAPGAGDIAAARVKKAGIT